MAVMLVVRSSALRREDAVLAAAECQEAACHPRRARQQRPERRGQRLQAAQRHQPHQAAQRQHRQAPAQLERALRQGQRRQRDQHGQEPPQEHLRLLFAPLRGQQPLQRHEVPREAAQGQRQQPPAGRAAAVLPAPAAGQVAGEEEEGTGDAEERAEAAGQAQQGVQRPRAPPAAPVLLLPGAAPAGKGQQREDSGGQDAQGEPSPAGGGGGEEQQGEEAPRGVLPQRGRAALHVSVPQALGAAVRLRAGLRGSGGPAGGGGRRFSLFPHGGRGRGGGSAAERRGSR